MKLIRLRQVMEVTGLGRSTIYKYIAENCFPKPVQLGERSVGWVESEVHEWIMERVNERNTRASWK
ncbi:helix-turn-helix transcriptional regulator [Stutzerimonas kunmingensis]|uniref:helix-turn-helix transcriptional regulator n=1 Tax=Stutzerimonas kunmingensis TaxID=1211807 RepID=UPI00241CDEEF|nr:AlpA family transcriptional regulator [Stutzerimonas kunmingensis]